MDLFDQFLNKNYRLLKIFIIGLALAIIIADQLVNYFFFRENLYKIIADSLISIILTLVLINFIFYLINIKQKQLNDQLNQLTEAYQYIGQINRKIDALLELDISTLDHSKKNSLHQSSTAIFRQLINLTQAKAGLFYLKPPLHFKIYHNENYHPELKKTFDFLSEQGIKEFKYSRVPENEQYFRELGINENLLKKYNLLIKPVYMHDQDIGHLLLLFPKNQNLEDRDINIIRIYSFYLALNYTFKPDLSLYQDKLE